MRQGYSTQGNVVQLSSQMNREPSGPNRTNWVARIRNLVLIGCIFWALWTYFFVQLPAIHKLEREKLELSHQLVSMQQEKLTLEKSVAKLGTDEYIERIVRQDYNMIKPGDVLYQSSGNK